MDPDILRKTEMSAVDRLVKDHADVLNRAQVLEKETLNFLEGRKELNREEYLATVIPNRALFKNNLLIHFRVEEMALFPIIIKKSEAARSTVYSLLKEHSEIMERFREFEGIRDYESSMVTLTDLMYTLSQHAMKEDELYSLITLSKDEETTASEVAGIIESWPPIRPY